MRTSVITTTRMERELYLPDPILATCRTAGLRIMSSPWQEVYWYQHHALIRADPLGLFVMPSGPAFRFGGRLRTVAQSLAPSSSSRHTFTHTVRGVVSTAPQTYIEHATHLEMQRFPKQHLGTIYVESLSVAQALISPRCKGPNLKTS